MDNQDNPIYVICKGNDGNYYIEDIENSRIYKFQNYNDIIDKSLAPKRFKLENLVSVFELPQLAEKVEIYECVNNHPRINSYSWKSNIIVDEGIYTPLKTEILDSIWTKMKWKKSE